MRRALAAALGAMLALAAPRARAAVSIYLPPAELASAAALVLEGTVARVASGYDPVTGSLATYVTLDIEAVPRGPETLTQVVLREPGGSYGGLVHEVDAVPTFRAGERVLVFAEPAADGALRTAGMFFGKYTILEDAARRPRALRDLTGRGTILRRPPEVLEEMPLDDLRALVEERPLRSDSSEAARPFRERPPELDRVLWGGESTPPAGPEFVPLSSSAPARWQEVDASTTIAVDIERARSPMTDPTAAVAEIARALATWTGVPESRVALRVGNDNARFTTTSASSPARALGSTNIVLFGDPYDDLSDPVSCAGTLATGGYWRSASPGTTVNGVRFYPALRLYVIFNRAFECFLSDPRNLAEIATHELGHGLGLGHSNAPDSIMRGFAYGNRGALLGNDDRDAVHCTYPHTLRVVAPNGQESWSAGSSHALTWTSTSEAGPSPGSVDLELSYDDGASFVPIATAVPNSGSFAWTLPRAVTSHARVRVLHRNLTSPAPAPFPAVCSQDASDQSFSIAASGLPAGSVPDGRGGDPLLVDKNAAGGLELRFGASCGAPSAYAVYEGALARLRAGFFDPIALTCSASLARSVTIVPGDGNRYYLVAAVQGASEGSLGLRSSGLARSQAPVPCAARETISCP